MKLTSLSPRSQGMIISIIYLVVIVGTVRLSGELSDKATLYDRFVVRQEGTLIRVSDYSQTVRFYEDILDFTPISKRESGTDRIVGFRLPGANSLYLDLVPAALTNPNQLSTNKQNEFVSVVVFRVKTGFEKLFNDYVQRIGHIGYQINPQNYAKDILAIPTGGISEIVTMPWGKEFIIKDLDMNLLIFYHPSLFVNGRY